MKGSHFCRGTSRLERRAEDCIFPSPFHNSRGIYYRQLYDEISDTEYEQACCVAYRVGIIRWSFLKNICEPRVIP